MRSRRRSIASCRYGWCRFPPARRVSPKACAPHARLQRCSRSAICCTNRCSPGPRSARSGPASRRRRFEPHALRLDVGFALLSTLCGGLTALRRPRNGIRRARVAYFHEPRRVRPHLGRCGVASDDSRRDRLRRDGRSAHARCPRRACISRRLFDRLSVRGRVEPDRLAHPSIRSEPCFTAGGVCAARGHRVRQRASASAAQHPAQWASHAAKFRADARAALERSRKALASVPATRTGAREAYDTLLALLTESEAFFAYLIAVSGACEKMRGDERRRPARRRLLTGMGETLPASAHRRTKGAGRFSPSCNFVFGGWRGALKTR